MSRLPEPEWAQFEPEPEGCGVIRILVICAGLTVITVALALQLAGVFS